MSAFGVSSLNDNNERVHNNNYKVYKYVGVTFYVNSFAEHKAKKKH